MPLYPSPSNAPAFDKMGLLLMKIGRTGDSLTFFRKAVALAPKDPGIRNNLGLLFAATGEPEKALAQFRQALALSPGFPGVEKNIEILNREIEARRSTAPGPVN